MTLTLTELRAIFPHQLWLEVSERTQAETWSAIAQHRYSNPAARWTAYLNTLCLSQVVSWLATYSDGEFLQLQSRPDASIWEMVNGTVITLDQTQIVLIPTDQTNPFDVCIPQEWVDIPAWVPDYYVAVQLNLVEGWLRVWGYTTRAQILDRSTYDRVTQTYALELNEVISNLDVMWVTQESCPPTTSQLPALPRLLPSAIEPLLAKLSCLTSFSPRLALPFPEWAAILASDENRERLYQLRLKQCELARPVTEQELALDEASAKEQCVFGLEF